MTGISKAYPYLSIAKKYNANYSTVLAAAHAATHHKLLPGFSLDAVGLPNEAIDDIIEARDHYRDVQAGVVAFPPT